MSGERPSNFLEPDDEEETEVIESEEHANDLLTAELRKNRDRLLEAIESTDRINAQKYAEKFLSFLAYQNGQYYDVPEFHVLADLTARLKAGRVRPEMRQEQIEQERLKIYQQIVQEMLQYERALDPEEAKMIREKITTVFNEGLKQKGISPGLR